MSGFSLAFLAVLVFVPLQDRSPNDKAILRHLKEVEWPKAYREQDVTLLDRILGEDFERIGFDGERSSKQDELERVRTSRPTYDSLIFTITRLDVFPNGTAIISGIGTVTGSDREGPFTVTYRSSNVLIKRGGMWKAVNSHVSGRKLVRMEGTRPLGADTDKGEGARAMPADQKINYLEMFAEDFDAVQAFYEKAFGWTFTDYGPEYRAFNDGTMDGGFRRGKLRSTTATGGALIILYAQDLEATRSKVLASGGKLVQDIFSFPGGRRFHFADPNGNELAVWSDR